MSRFNQLRRLASTAAVATALLTTTGCEKFEQLFEGESRATVNFFVAHHASGELKAAQNMKDYRVFTNDEGWEITLTSAYVVTSGVTLHRCSGETIDIELFWGTLAEDLARSSDDTFTLGGTEVKGGDYCGLTVHYGPYDLQDGYAERDADLIAGNTVLLGGGAQKGGDMVPFQVVAQGSLDVFLDLSTFENGEPLHIRGDEPFPVELTLTKTYDAFFDGVDFSAMEHLDMTQQVLTVLEFETDVVEGTRLSE